MRHLAGLGDWKGWEESEVFGKDKELFSRVEDGKTDWSGWLAARRK